MQLSDCMRTSCPTGDLLLSNVLLAEGENDGSINCKVKQLRVFRNHFITHSGHKLPIESGAAERVWVNELKRGPLSPF